MDAKQPIRRLTDERIAAALVEAGGYIEHAARLVRCSKQTIYTRIHESEVLRAALEEARDEMDRAADITLLDAVHGKGVFAGDAGARVRAAMFIKNNSPASKSRGWGMRSEVVGIHEVSVVFADIDAADADGASEPDTE